MAPISEFLADPQPNPPALILARQAIGCSRPRPSATRGLQSAHRVSPQQKEPSLQSPSAPTAAPTPSVAPNLLEETTARARHQGLWRQMEPRTAALGCPTVEPIPPSRTGPITTKISRLTARATACSQGAVEIPRIVSSK